MITKDKVSLYFAEETHIDILSLYFMLPLIDGQIYLFMTTRHYHPEKLI